MCSGWYPFFLVLYELHVSLAVVSAGRKFCIQMTSSFRWSFNIGSRHIFSKMLIVSNLQEYSSHFLVVVERLCKVGVGKSHYLYLLNCSGYNILKFLHLLISLFEKHICLYHGNVSVYGGFLQGELNDLVAIFIQLKGFSEETEIISISCL